MTPAEYISNKKTYFESLENELRLFHMKHLNLLKELTERMDGLKEQEKEVEFQGRFSAGKKDEILEQDIQKLEDKIHKVQSELADCESKMRDCLDELKEINRIVFKEEPAKVDSNIKNTIQLCSLIALQDPQRCKLELEQLLRSI